MYKKRLFCKNDCCPYLNCFGRILFDNRTKEKSVVITAQMV